MGTTLVVFVLSPFDDEPSLYQPDAYLPCPVRSIPAYDKRLTPWIRADDVSFNLT